ncbi:protein lethal(2)essential for life-like [Schistocerca piceifrons]|uniref:protein lethal(2)essential for life-like n=1 Tax=Schistocerca piceifrons TaxID=274613 RepID=UPI001F5EC75E|nr:protein lethal(2)essential for life-like [Schistocerca piceifrons]
MATHTNDLEVVQIDTNKNIIAETDGASPTLNTNGTFVVKVDVQQFLWDNIPVKPVDNFPMAEGKRVECEVNNGFITRHFTQSYELPTDSAVIMTGFLTEDFLTIKAPKNIMIANYHFPTC